MAKEKQRRTVTVWDLPVRLFHWLLVLCLLGSWFTGENQIMDLHEIFGVTALVLILFRVVWGFVGGEFARFRSFLRGPPTVVSYLRRMLRRDLPETGPGHNPAGGWSVIAMLLIIAAQVGSGLFSNDDIFFEGPMARFVSDEASSFATVVHHRLFNVVVALIALHVLVVAAYWIGFRKNLVWPMITGTAEVLPRDVPVKPRRASLLLAVLVLALTAVAVIGVAYYA